MAGTNSAMARSNDSSGRTLIDRVQDRVSLAQQALERRDHATLPKARRKAAKAAPVDPSAKPMLSPQVRALRSVFLDLGDVHRSYRRRTGEPVSPVLRNAALAFKQDQTLTSLVPVAEYLDDLDLLEW